MAKDRWDVASGVRRPSSPSLVAATVPKNPTGVWGGQKEKMKGWQQDAIMGLMDPNGTGQVSLEEFELFMQAPLNREGLEGEVRELLEGGRVDPVGSVGSLCRTLDPDGNQLMGKGEIEVGLAKLGLSLTKAELDTLWDSLNGYVWVAQLPRRHLSRSEARAVAEGGRVALEILDAAFADSCGAGLISDAHLAAAMGENAPSPSAAAAADANDDDDERSEGSSVSGGGPEPWVVREGFASSAEETFAEKAYARVREVIAGGYPAFKLSDKTDDERSGGGGSGDSRGGYPLPSKFLKSEWAQRVRAVLLFLAFDGLGLRLRRHLVHAVRVVAIRRSGCGGQRVARIAIRVRGLGRALGQLLLRHCPAWAPQPGWRHHAGLPRLPRHGCHERVSES